MPAPKMYDSPDSMSGRNGRAPDDVPHAGRSTPPDNYPGKPAPSPATAEDLPPLSESDQRHLLEYQKKTQLLRDRVVGVVGGRTTGIYAYGPGGTGKSHTVIATLPEFQANYRIHNSRMDGRGLFTALERDPDAVHVLEDCEQMMRNRNVRGLLRSALWG